MKDNNNEIGLRIRTARKQKGMNQTQLATELGKSLRTIQKYESGEIEVSIGVINDIAKVLDTTSTYLIGYQAEAKTITNMADVMQFLFHLDQLNELGFSIDVKRPPNHDGWECSITFNGKDNTASENADMCLFLEEFNEKNMLPMLKQHRRTRIGKIKRSPIMPILLFPKKKLRNLQRMNV